MIDASVVLTSGVSRGPVVLSPASPDTVLDGGTNGCSAPVLSGLALVAEIDNSFAQVGGWSQVPAGSTVTVPAGKRYAVRNGAPTTVLGRPVWA